MPASAPKITHRHFGLFSSFHTIVCFFLITCFRDRKTNFQIIFTPSLKSVEVIRPSLVN